jgi:hypothetical protein
VKTIFFAENKQNEKTLELRIFDSKYNQEVFSACVVDVLIKIFLL